jgi:hypothetical protein
MIPSTANFDNIIIDAKIILLYTEVYKLFATGETGEEMRGT